MSHETSKANKRRVGTYLYNKVFSGEGIDIGCGGDILKKDIYPNISTVEPFDLQHGDAQYIDTYVKKQFDFVHSSQCLEHMVDANIALQNWWKIVKPGGYLIFTMPDEDLYEQGVFPSRWNHDHKWTFSIYKKHSWSFAHLNILDMIQHLDSYEVLKIELIDTNYNYNLTNQDQTLGNVEAFIEVILKKRL
jgi:SAM-dependent methyltransferase